jgi:hypothetical protein
LFSMLAVGRDALDDRFQGMWVCGCAAHSHV